MNVIPFPSAIFSVEGRRDDDTTVDQQALVATAAGAEAHGSALEPRAAAAAGGEPGGRSVTPESDDSSSDGDDEPDTAPVSTGFKLNLGKVAANQVDDTKPVAVPHTPKGEVVQELLAQQGSSGAESALQQGGGVSSISEGEDSSEGGDEEPPPASTGFKINLSRVGKNVVDDVKPVAVPHTPKGDVVQGLLAKQRSIGAVVGTARPHVKRAASVATVRPDRCYRLPRGSWAMGSDARLGQDHLFLLTRQALGTALGSVGAVLRLPSRGGGGSSVDTLDGSSSDGDDEPEPAPVSTGFKLNLGKVAANQVDDAKPIAVPHTPKGELVQGLLAAQGGSSSDSSSEGDDEEPPPASTGFKINLSRVGKNVVDDAKPVSIPHTPKGKVVQELLVAQGGGSNGGGGEDSEVDSSSEEDFGPPPVATGFKLNLGSVAANHVDDAKPVAVPHTPKGEVVRGLARQTSTATEEELDTPRFGSQGSQDSSIGGDGAGGEDSEVDSSGDEEDFDPPPASTGFKLNLGKVAANQVDGAKPVAMPHTPKREVVQGLLAAQGGGSNGSEDSEMDSSSQGDDEPEHAPVSTGFKLNLGSVAANQVDDTKPVAMPHTPKGELMHGLLAAGVHDLGSGGSCAPTSARGKLSKASCSSIDLGALAQLGVQEGVVEQIEQGLARGGSLIFGIGGGIGGIGGGGGGGGGGGVLTRRPSAVPVDTTGDGKVDALAIDSNKDGRIDALIKLGDLGGTEVEAVGAALSGPAADPSVEARARAVVAGGGKGGKESRHVLAEALAAMRPLDAFPVAQPLDSWNAAQSMSSSIISLASRCFDLGISHDRGISKVTTYCRTNSPIAYLRTISSYTH